MSKKRTTHPSLYFERQSPAKEDTIIEYREPGIQDGEVIMMILGMAVCGFALGMLVVAFWAGVL